MAILMFIARKHDLISQQYKYQARLQELTRKLSDMQQYAANIADGSVSMFDMMNTPASMFGRTMMYMTYSHNMAVQNAQMNFMNMQPMIAQQMMQMDPTSQMMYQQWIQQSLYKQERERMAKIEAKLMNQQEQEIMQEKQKIEAQLKMIEQELENIIAKDSVTLNGDRIHGQNITQNKDAGGDLIINTGSNGGDGPIESLVIDKIDANDKSVFTDLWAVNADITTADDKMDFNKILIEEMAWLKNTGTLATVYGNIPVKDDDANVHIYQAYPSMFINFVDADTVETDGRLLSLDNYWYAYDQRFTAEDHMRWQHGRYLDEDWKQAYGYGLSLHDRYGLIDYQHFTEENAGEDEIAVEA